MSLAMTRQEREAFLADVHVGIISIADEGRGPLAAARVTTSFTRVCNEADLVVTANMKALI
jgi:hypothetical protein